MIDKIIGIFIMLVLVVGIFLLDANRVEASEVARLYLNGMLGMPTCDWAPYMYCT